MADVRVIGLRKSYDATTVLHGLDLEIADGELLTLLGPSGCGKTTTLRCLAGLERPDAGEIHVGPEILAAPERRLFVPPNRRDVGMVFQSYALWPHMTVAGNVAYPLKLRRTARREVATRVGETLSAVGMADYAARPVTELSGGEQQRVALARALVARPRVLLLDEPLSNLDAKLRIALRKEIRAAHERTGTTSVYVTHDQAEAIALSDRIVVLDEGRIQQVGTPVEIYRRPHNRFVAEFVGYENILAGTVAVRDGDTVGIALAPDGSVLRTWPASSDGVGESGADVLVAARAEDLRLVAGDGGSVPSGLVPGTVATRAYAGERWEYTVELAAGSVLVREPDGERPFDPGEDLAVDFGSPHVVVLADDGGSSRPDSRLVVEAAPPPVTGRPAA